MGGRLGSARGPLAFRKAFGKLAGRDGVHAALDDRSDAQPIGGDVAANHRAAADLVRASHAASGLSVVVGGGHDHGYSHLLGLHEALGKDAKLGCINIDAHLDVRKPLPPSFPGGAERITSGSPFYLALESGVLAPERFVELGIQPQCNRPELWDYAEKKGVEIIGVERLRQGRAPAEFAAALARLARECDAVAVSLDLDAIACAFAPGVSAPQAEGLTPAEVFEMLEGAGREPRAVSLGIFELNPDHDTDGATTRLAATAAYRFVAAALKRPS